MASTVGSVVEWYDFLLFGALAPVLAKLFFPSADPFASQLAAYATFGIAFVARPVGALLFGGIGDQVGRKAMLVWTLLFMAVATVGIGLLPTYHQVGVLAPVALVLLRLVQGAAVGVEWAGAVLLPMEWSKPQRRGLFAAVPQTGGALGIITGNLLILFTSNVLTPGASFMAYGWRIPFLLSIVLLVIGLVIRLGVLDTPPFAEVLERKGKLSMPMLTAIVSHPRKIIACFLLRVGQQGG